MDGQRTKYAHYSNTELKGLFEQHKTDPEYLKELLKRVLDK